MDPRLKQYAKRFRVVKWLVGSARARRTRAYACWLQGLARGGEGLLRQAGSAPGARCRRPRVLLATSLGAWQPGTRLDSVLGLALRLRGAEPHVWLCDQALPACLMADAYFYPDQGPFLRHGPRRDLCPGCFRPADELFRALGFPVHHLGELVTAEEERAAAELATRLPMAEMERFVLDDVAVGEHALSGALRFYARGDLDGEPRGEAVLRAYFRATLLTLYAIRRLLGREEFDCAVLHHGIYVPQGTISEVCRKAGVRVVTWHPAYRRNCFTFAMGDTYHRAMITEPVENWQDIPWSEEHERVLMEYLSSRWRGSRDWISFNRRPEEDVARIAVSAGLDPGKPWIGMLTSVMWDARLHYPANAFASVQEWVRCTIEYFARRPDLQLVIRVHPAEVRGRLPARHRVVEEISKAFPTLPDNVAVIPPESRVSSYVVMLHCNAALIYATKMGIELAAMGIPVVVAGEAWIRNKGFSLDADSPEQYLRLLERLPLPRPMSPEAVRRARKYAFHYFFRRMIPLEFVRQGSGRSLAFDVELDSLEGLRPGRSLGLDVICDGILQGTEFIYPAEERIRTPSEAPAVGVRSGP